MATMSALNKSAEVSQHIITMDDWKHARSVVGPSITRGVTVEIPRVSWDDIGGLKDLKKKLQQSVEWPLKHSSAFFRMGVSYHLFVAFFFMDLQVARKQTTLAKAAVCAAKASFFSLRIIFHVCW